MQGSRPRSKLRGGLRSTTGARGYATEAARAVVRDAFDRLGLAEIIAVTTPGNVRSRRVMEKLGMVYSPSETFEHPRIPEGNPLRTHIVYRLGS
jgi:RimJ/RimL family protein N-acetyltransferase